MSGHYSFTSCFAPFIESMITEKRNAGFQYEHAEWILHKFDEFCNQEQVETPVITQELAGKWGTLRKTETKVTLAGRISVLRQLSLTCRHMELSAMSRETSPVKATVAHMF